MNSKKSPEEKEIDRLLDLLKDEDYDVRNKAALVLRTVSEKNELVVPTLIKALKSEHQIIREKAAQILGWIGEKSKPAVTALIEALEDKHVNVRITTAYALGAIGENAELAVPALIEALKHEYADLRYTAAWALAEMGEKAEPAVPALIEALNDKSGGVRTEAARALAEIGEKAEPAVLALIEALNDKSGGVQYEAARAISRFGEDVKKSAIIKLKVLITKEQDNNNKFKLTESLIQIEGKEGEGTKIIEDLKKKRKLTEWQIKRFNYICQKLRIEEQVEEVKKGVHSVQKTTKSMRKRVEEEPEITGKELMVPIKRIEATFTTLPKKILELTQLIQEMLQVKRINFPRSVLETKLNELTNEVEFQKLLMTILPDLGFENCELCHGVLELGKDIVGITYDNFKILEGNAFVVKFGRISKSVINAILNQIRECANKKYTHPNLGSITIKRIYVVTNETLTAHAKDSIEKDTQSITQMISFIDKYALLEQTKN